MNPGICWVGRDPAVDPKWDRAEWSRCEAIGLEMWPPKAAAPELGGS